VEQDCENVEQAVLQKAGTNNVEQAVMVNSGVHERNNKKYFCPFCHLSVTRLPRHLYSAHSTESDVAEVMASSNRQRKHILLTKLRNLGSHLHNENILSSGSGHLSVVYRPSSSLQTDGTHFLPCRHCLGWFRRGQLFASVNCRSCTARLVRIQIFDLLLLEGCCCRHLQRPL
jgi:hypothetical protein